MVSTLRKLHAKFFLALSFFRHLIYRLVFFWKKFEGHDRFLSQYREDAILPISKDEREALASYQKCQACSLCTFSCQAIREGKAPSDFEPKFILLALGRSSHEAEFFHEDWLPCMNCHACSVECPNNVPIHAMAERVVLRRKQVAFR